MEMLSAQSTARAMCPLLLSSLFIIIIIILMIIVPVEGNTPVLLNATFVEVRDAVGSLLVVSATHHDIRTAGECAVLCSDARSDAPECQAFQFHPLDGTCDLYFYPNSLSLTHALFAAPTPTDDDVLFQFITHDVFYGVLEDDGKHYAIYASSSEKTYYDASAHCQRMGAHLLHFDSSGKMDAVRQIVHTGILPLGFYWVGASDSQTEGLWRSEWNGWPIDDWWPGWEMGEPNDNGGAEDCALLLPAGGQQMAGLRDADCTGLRRYLCEKSDDEPVPYYYYAQ